MKPKLLVYRAIFLSLFAALLVGCGAGTNLSKGSGTEPVPVTASTATPTPAPVVTNTSATRPTLPLPTSTLQPAPRLTPTNPNRPPAGWTIFSNPDFIRGIAVHNGEVWTATTGGVARWDLKSGAGKLFTTRDGLVDIQGNGIVYCPIPEDRILVAHNFGMLSEYNLQLKKWSRVPISFPDGTTFNEIQVLFCDALNNRLLVGSPDGLGIYNFNTGLWKRIGPAEGLKVSNYRAIGVVGQTIWIAAGEQSAFMIQGSTIFPFNGESGFPSGPVNDLVVAPDNSIWLGYPTGLVHYYDRKWNSYGAQLQTGIPFYSVDQVRIGPDHKIWIASSDGGICPFEPATLQCSTIYPAIRGKPITDLVVDADGIAYAGTEGGGVMVLQKDSVRQLVFNNQQLMSNNITDISEGSDEMLWVSTDRGVNILDPAQPAGAWQALVSSRGKLALSNVAHLQSTSNGMWFFYEQKPQASFFDGNTWLHLDALKGISGPVLASAIDQHGYIWLAATHAINIWDGATMRTYGPESGLPGNTFQALMSDVDGMWVGSDRGLLRYARYQWQTVLPNVSVRAIHSDENGGLLLGTDKGLIHLKDGQSYLWIINLGKEIMINPVVTSIARDNHGNLWVGTWGEGLFIFNGATWERFDTTRGLPSNTVRKVFTDHLGAVWIAAVTENEGGALVRFMP